jgi:IclR family KDG regulon transcriptional repressor
VIKGRIKLREVAIPHLVKLSRLVGESVILAVWDGREVVLTETVHPPGDTYRPLKVIPDEGTRSPLHCTSVGKIILATLTKEDLKRYFTSKSRERFTPNTIVDMSAMEKHLSLVRKEGIAYDDEEYTVGVRGISAALRNGEGKTVGAIGVLGPSVRLTRATMRGLSSALRDCALKVSKELGYQGPN